ncbi:MAG TPA: radical SAM protein [Thermoplasmatales archaeon]|nr:radical SAM protein [Thermoplasmatales archaeon]
MNVIERYCKTALSLSHLPGLDYSLNPYRGCQHACTYCYVPSVLHISRDDWGEWVETRVNIPTVLSRELKKKPKGVVGISTVTDPYQPLEKKYCLTRFCLKQLLKHDFPVSIQTKSNLVLRDKDIISRFSDAEVGVTVTTLNDDERKLLEPCAPSIEKRLDTIKKLSDEGIKTYIFFGPVYPTVEVKDIPEIIKRFSETGASMILVDSLHLKKGVWESINKKLFSNQKTLEIFTRRLFEDKNYYTLIFDEIDKQSRRYGLRVEKAF